MASVDAQTEASPTTEPTDRSMPPPMMTKVIPMLSTPMTEARRRIVRTLSMLANRSPAVATPTMQMATRAMTRPRLRPAGPCRSPLRGAFAARSWRLDDAVVMDWPGAAAPGSSCSLTRHFLP